MTAHPGTGPDSSDGLDRTSLSDWAAGYQAGHAAGRAAGFEAGYEAGRTVLDDAATALAQLQPSRAVDVVRARAALTAPGRRAGEVDHDDPVALAAYRARIYASWGLDPPSPDPPDKANSTTGSATPAPSPHREIRSSTARLTRTRQHDGRHPTMTDHRADHRPGNPRPATPAGYTRAELALIHATAKAHGLSVSVCCRVLDDAELPPQQPGTVRPEVAQILRGINRDRQTTTTQPTRLQAARQQDVQAVGLDAGPIVSDAHQVIDLTVTEQATDLPGVPAPARTVTARPAGRGSLALDALALEAELARAAGTGLDRAAENVLGDEAGDGHDAPFAVQQDGRHA